MKGCRVSAILLWFFLVPAAMSGAVTPHVYPIADRGSLILQVPSDWTESVRGADTGLPPTITLTGPDAAVKLLITPIWSLRKDPAFNSPERLEALIADSASRVQPTAVESQLSLNEITTASGKGYYFTATDRSPKPGEFEYMAQGAVPAGGFLLSFTVLTHEKPPGGVAPALAIVRSAKHE